MATALVSSGISFSRFYLVLLAHRALCLPVHCWSFWNFERHNKPSDDLPSSTAPSRHSQLRELKKAVANKVTLFAALFIFCYQGAEVSISGWVLNYLIAYRGGIPDKVGYVTAGFWVSSLSFSFAYKGRANVIITTGRYHRWSSNDSFPRQAHRGRDSRLRTRCWSYGLPSALLAGAQYCWSFWYV